MKNEPAKAPQGRKPIPEGERKQKIIIYVSKDEINTIGGDESVKVYLYQKVREKLNSIQLEQEVLPD